MSKTPVMSCLALLTAVCLSLAVTAKEVKPNIIVIMADDLGYNDLSSYGQQNFSTPNIDTLAREGMRFTQFYSGTPVCAPSRSSYMTGVDTGHSRIRGNANYFNRRTNLRAEDVTIAEVLKSADYTTGHIGKWHMGLKETTGLPMQQGFDFWFGRVDRDRHETGERKFYLNGEEYSMPSRAWDHDYYTRFAKEFIEDNARKRTPFYLNLAYRTPHASEMRLVNQQELIDIAPEFANRAGWSDGDKRVATMIRALDENVGELTALLDRLKIRNKTLVLFTSDNGPHKEGGSDPETFDRNGPLRGIKRDMYEGGIRVPMIAYWPGTIAPEQESAHMSAFLDIMPTLAQAAGLPRPASTHGVSFLPTLLGEAQPQHSHLYWEMSHRHTTFKQGLRVGDWKALRVSHNAPLELYHLPSDPYETRDLAPRYPDFVQYMDDQMRRARQDNPEFYPGVVPDRPLPK